MGFEQGCKTIAWTQCSKNPVVLSPNIGANQYNYFLET